MLESVAVIVHVIIVVVRIAEEDIFLCKYEGRAHIRSRKACLRRIAEGENVLFFVLQVATVFIAQVGSGMFISDTLAGLLYAHRTMICSNEQLYAFISYLFQSTVERGVLEPTNRE